MNKQVYKHNKLQLRKNRVRARVSGSSERPRLAVSRSASHIYAQIIDDTSGRTLAAADSIKVKANGKKSEVAHAVGKEIGKQAMDKKIDTVVFDRGGYRYHGRVKALAEGAREAGLKF